MKAANARAEKVANYNTKDIWRFCGGGRHRLAHQAAAFINIGKTYQLENKADVKMSGETACFMPKTYETIRQTNMRFCVTALCWLACRLRFGMRGGGESGGLWRRRGHLGRPGDPRKLLKGENRCRKASLSFGNSRKTKKNKELGISCGTKSSDVERGSDISGKTLKRGARAK